MICDKNTHFDLIIENHVTNTGKTCGNGTCLQRLINAGVNFHR